MGRCGSRQGTRALTGAVMQDTGAWVCWGLGCIYSLDIGGEDFSKPSHLIRAVEWRSSVGAYLLDVRLGMYRMLDDAGDSYR